jgi:7-cyano-7-deazaguanine synthase in queuosine biosynthesis
MIEPRLIVCSGAKIASGEPVAAGRRRIELDSIGKDPNVHIRIENVARVLQRQLTPRLIDLLEIAAYVYAADCSTQRGKKWTDEFSTEPWGRDFAFVIPVREPDFWGSAEVSSQLTDVLNFLSNDRYSFNFVPLQHDRPEQPYLEFGEPEDWPFHQPERVVMFSGGLDSLAGAVETARAGGKLVLVSHRPVTTLDSRQRKLFSELLQEFPGQLIHVPVWINKYVGLSRESTQRTRAFLFAALGTVVAESVQAGGVRFFENGIVSLNLPVAEEAIRARASRTTHPVALHLLQSLCSVVTGRNIAVDNPYLFKTKTDVVRSLSAHRAAHLISSTCSCAHPIFQSKTQWHCGRCSQCIDRRFAIVEAGLQAHDSDMDYVTDVFVGPRKDGAEKNMAVDYLRHGLELSRLSESEMAAHFNAELSRAVRYETKRSEAAERLIAMHKRHGEGVACVLEKMIQEQAGKLVQGTLDESSLLALFLGKKHLEAQRQEAPARKEGQSGAVKDLDGITTDSQTMEKLLSSILAKFGA